LARKTTNTEPQEVNVALQTPSGRLINKFSPGVSLWDILNYWEKEKGLNLTADGDIPPNSTDNIKYYMQPVITYTTKEIGTNAELRSTTLSTLGLTSGSGMLRLLHKYTTLPYEEFLKLDEQNAVKEKVVEENLSKEVEAKRLQEQKEKEERARLERESSEALKKAAEEEQMRMNERRMQYLKEEEEKNHHAELQMKRQLELQKEREIEEQKKLERERMEEYKTIIVHDKLQIIRDATKRQREAEVLNVPQKTIDRNPQVFAPSSVPFDPRSIDIPDDFYEVTAQDFKQNALIMKERKKKEQQQNSVLRTKEMRERDKAKSLSKYTKCFIRIRFPDRSELQGTFGPHEKPAAIYAFVLESLREENRTVEFHLYTIPPKNIISADKDIIIRDLGFLPAALIHFGITEGAQMQMPFLREELTKSIAEKLPPPEIYIPKTEQTIVSIQVQHEESTEPKVPQPAPTEPTEEETETKKLPAWFSKGKKH